MLLESPVTLESTITAGLRVKLEDTIVLQPPLFALSVKTTVQPVQIRSEATGFAAMSA